MKCYNHHERDAFGIDTTTGKALCLECLEDYKGRIIEKNNEHSKIRVDLTDISYEYTKKSEKVMQHNEKIMSFNDKSMKFVFIFSKIVGIISAIFLIISFFIPDAVELRIAFTVLFLICLLGHKNSKNF